jgi:hypothetical protein
VAIVGWDDAKVPNDMSRRGAPKPGAWLIRNSWGRRRGDDGYYWISYYDKVCCRDEEMGAVSFRNIVPLPYDHIYCHDYHGWRATLKEMTKALNAFSAVGDQQLKAISFYTAADGVSYTARIYKRFDNDGLADPVAEKSGVIAVKGFHTIDLPAPVNVKSKEKFYLYLELSHGGQPIDRTSEIPVLLGQSASKVIFDTAGDMQLLQKPPAKKTKPKPGMGPNGPLVISKANPGESYYWDGSSWKDLYDYRFENPNWATFDHTANFCMKALACSSNNGNGK